ncbi:MAG: 2-amino-4-hydroxy-6-hydroxymethyldihydropteridine diphosphokinase [Thermoleophilia bacterium]
MRYWLGLGANLGDRRAALQAAVDHLAARHEVEAVSSLYETAPRDLEDQPAFLNAAVRVRAEQPPPALLDEVKAMERELGRAPGGVRFGPRAIDCDLLLWEGGEWRDDRLEIPHPRLGERLFALLPLLDLDPGLRLPDGRSLSAMAAAIDPSEQPAARLPEGLRQLRGPGGGQL